MGKTITTAVLVLAAVIPIFALEPEPRTLSIQESAEMSFPPDLCIVTIAVETLNKDQTKAYEENATIMNRINEAVKAQGIEPKDMRTTSFVIRPEYRRERNNKQVFLGYMVYHHLEVKVRDFKKILPIIEKSMEAGATRIGNLNFTFEDPKKYEAQVREKAMKAARAKATQLAELEGFKLGKAILISEFSPLETSVVRATRLLGVSGVYQDIDIMGLPQLIIEPGEIKLTYTIYITYELE